MALYQASLTSTYRVVIAGLDPAIHHFGIELFFTMDARVKPAHDESGFVKLGIILHFDRRDGAAAAIFRQRRQTPDGRLAPLPNLWPLRGIAVPGPRIKIAQLLVLELVELDIELDRVLVRIAVIGRDIVARAVAQRAPQQL